MGWAPKRESIAAALVLLATACDSFDQPAAKEVDDPGQPADAGQLDPTICVDSAPEPPSQEFEVTGCVHARGGGMLAVFDWTNRTGMDQTEPYGARNNLAPGDDAQGQGEWFGLGESGRFAVPLAGSPVTWTILDRVVTVSDATEDCGERCEHLQLAGPDGYLEDTCTEACGDGDCDAGETCASCAADCDCSALEPLLDCVRERDDGMITASFGFRNDSERAAAIAPGSGNGFSPGDQVRGQPSFFAPGESHHVFQVTFGESELTWTLGALSVSATSAGPACADDCDACPEGSICVVDECRTSCGDGVCSEGNCAACPVDCGCPAADICWHGGCASVPQCGVEAHCGAREEFGVRVECGDCADGQVCQANVCIPLCGG